MRAFCAPEVLDGNNQFYCERCQAKRDAHKVVYTICKLISRLLLCSVARFLSFKLFCCLDQLAEVILCGNNFVAIIQFQWLLIVQVTLFIWPFKPLDRCVLQLDRVFSCLQTLKFLAFPYLLTIHLLRFDFDYNTFRRIKLNHRLHSPLYCIMQLGWEKSAVKCEIFYRNSLSEIIWIL